MLSISLREEARLRTLLRKRKRPVVDATQNSASDGMRIGASPQPASTPMYAHSAIRPHIEDLNAQRGPLNLQPRRFRGFIWNEQADYVTPLATLSETLRPLPRPPASELRNPIALKTIADNPSLFKVATPINVDRFEFLLRHHPNRPLVDSVCDGLRYGFWPFAEPDLESFPITLEMDNGPLSSDDERFILQYMEDEQREDRFSPPFGPDLLPGMYAMPVYTIPKANSDKLRLINNHSAGPFSLNSMIDKSKVGMRPDNIQDLGRNLLAFRQKHGDIPLWLFKSDVKGAYRHLPMHPLWQLRQVVKVANRCQIDWCCCFGSRGSPDIWCSFICLVLWIAIYVKLIELLLAFMDDHFSFDASLSLSYYPPYDSYFPPKQVQLLLLWDELGIRHEKAKQVFGRDLTIIGFHVDATEMIISLPSSSIHDIVSHIRSFCTSTSRRHPLREWQRLLGWLNWAINIQPLLRPALQSSYEKIRNRYNPFGLIYINRRVYNDLLWAADRLDRSAGVFMLKSKVWSPEDADLTFYCDACLTGMGFWSPQLFKGFMADTIPSTFLPDDNIFWFEALTVLSAFIHASSLSSPPVRLAIFSDNLNTVQMFESLRSHPPYDLILRNVIDVVIDSNIDFRVWYIPGPSNVVADALSRGLLSVVHTHLPNLPVFTFQPPRITLGAAPK